MANIYTDASKPSYHTVKGYNVAEMLAHVRRLVHDRIGATHVDQLALLFKREFLNGEVFLQERNPLDFGFWVARRYPGGFASILDRERTRLLKQVISVARQRAQEFHRALRNVAYPRDHYSDPGYILRLPFPYYIDSSLADRFAIQNGSFNYAGRERFAELDTAIKSLDYWRRGQSAYVRGSLGYGKSHILAAMACLLMQDKEKRVVYLPDCAALYTNPITTIQSALLVAFADRPDICPTIEAASELQDFRNFFLNYEESLLYWVLDLVDAVDLKMTSTRTVEEIRAVLWEMSSTHYVIFSAVGIYLSRYARARTITLSGGLTENEMNEWWKRAKLPLTLKSADKGILQDLTGKVPLFLRPLLSLTLPPDLTSNYNQAMEYIYAALFAAKEIRAVSEQVVQFARSMVSGNRKKDYLYNAHACLTQSPVIEESSLIDWRYFQLEGEYRKGSATCGLARRTLAAYLKSVSHHRDFLTPTWMYCVMKSGGNVPILGFYLEQTVISSLVINGCPVSAFLQDFGGPKGGWTAESFAGEVPVISTRRRGTTIYVPMEYNYKAVDAIMVHQRAAAGRVGKPKAIIMGIKITIAENYHSKSELDFFENWEAWIRQLEDFDVEARFLWIRKAARLPSIQEKAAGTHRRWDGKIIMVPPFTEINATVASIDKDIASDLKWARIYARRDRGMDDSDDDDPFVPLP